MFVILQFPCGVLRGTTFPFLPFLLLCLGLASVCVILVRVHVCLGCCTIVWRVKRCVCVRVECGRAVLGQACWALGLLGFGPSYVCWVSGAAVHVLVGAAGCACTVADVAPVRGPHTASPHFVFFESSSSLIFYLSKGNHVLECLPFSFTDKRKKKKKKKIIKKCIPQPPFQNFFVFHISN